MSKINTVDQTKTVTIYSIVKGFTFHIIFYVAQTENTMYMPTGKA